MNVRRNILGFFILALAAIALSVSTSNAQEFQGEFTLHRVAQWGKVVLPPGQYNMTLARFQGGQRMVTVRSEAAGDSAAMIVVGSHNASPSVTKDSLVCIREGGALVVRSLELGAEGEIIYFQMPKNAPTYAQRRGAEEQTLLAQGPQLIQRVPVEFDGR